MSVVKLITGNISLFGGSYYNAKKYKDKVKDTGNFILIAVFLFVVLAAEIEQSDLSSLYGVCLIVCLLVDRELNFKY